MIAEEDSTWIGRKVVAKYHYPINSGDQPVEMQNRFRVYTVERVEGERLWVKAGSAQGWIPVSQALLCDTAIDFYTQEIAKNPGNSAAWSERGIILVNKEESDKAIADFNEAIRLDPTNAIAYGSRSIVWTAKNEYEKAFADVTAAIQLDPMSAAGYAQRGYIWMVREEFDKAITDYNQALRLDPAATSILCYRGLAWLAKKEYDKAIADFDEAIPSNPEFEWAYGNRGIAWQSKKENEKAIADFNEAIRLDPKNAIAHSLRGYAWREMKKHDKAIADYNEAIRLDPTNALSYAYRGLVWNEKKENDKAITDFNEAIRIDPRNAMAHSERGNAWLVKNDLAKALADYTEAIRLDPNVSVPVDIRNRLRATSPDGEHRESEKGSGRALIAFHIRCWAPLLAPILGPVLGSVLLFLTQLALHGTIASALQWAIVCFVVPMVAAVCLRVFLGRHAHGGWRQNFWPWRLSRRIVGFRTVESDRVSVLFPAGLDELLDLQETIGWSESDLDDLSKRFGIRLPRRLTVVLFSSHRHLTEDFGRPMGGTALMQANAVLLAADSPLREGLRHELAHLFAFRWSTTAPPLVQEGLAVWLQSITPEKTDTDEDIGSFPPFDTDPSLMLDPQHFFAPNRAHLSYALAGRFTDFLIRRFGWDAYRQFYAKADQSRFQSVFQSQFGIGFEAAWQRCHDEYVARGSPNRGLEQDLAGYDANVTAAS